MKKIIDILNDKLYLLESNLLASANLYLRYNSGEHSIELIESKKTIESFEIDDFKDFVRELQEFIEFLEI